MQIQITRFFERKKKIKVGMVPKPRKKKYSRSQQFYLESRLAVCYPCFFLSLSLFFHSPENRQTVK